ncbi:hypothetical protein HK101_000505 [Irineochytrium annulatum]|nr:hypothetical protein HK101_000505 [Irineochytrium annulatum]
MPKEIWECFVKDDGMGADLKTVIHLSGQELSCVTKIFEEDLISGRQKVLTPSTIGGVAREGDQENETVSHSVTTKRKLSVVPINLGCLAEFDNVVISVVSHNGIDFSVCAYNAELEDIWQCKVETLKAVSKDRQNRTVSQMKHDFSKSSTASAYNASEDIVTSICADRFRRQILVSLKTGAALSITLLQAKEVSNAAAPVKPPSAPGVDPVPLPEIPQSGQQTADSRRFITIAFCLEAQAAHVGLVSNEQAAIPEKATPSKDAGGINYIEAFVNQKSHQPAVVIGCSDGTLRTYSVDNGFVSGSPCLIQTVDSMDDHLDPAEISSISRRKEYYLWGTLLDIDDAQMMLTHSSDGILSVFDVNSQPPLLEMRVLSNRYTLLKEDLDQNAKPKKRSINIIDPEKGNFSTSVIMAPRKKAAIAAGAPEDMDDVFRLLTEKMSKKSAARQKKIQEEFERANGYIQKVALQHVSAYQTEVEARISEYRAAVDKLVKERDNIVEKLRKLYEEAVATVEVKQPEAKAKEAVHQTKGGEMQKRKKKSATLALEELFSASK